jgi:hypothetical protein
MISMRWGGAFLTLALAAHALAATTAPTTNPAILEAQKSVRAGRIVEVATRVEWTLGEQAKDFSHANLDELVRLATLRGFGRFFARVNQPDEGTTDTLAWLLAQPKLAPVLMMAATSLDPPERVAEVVRALRADEGKKLDEFADLAAAVCLVWDAPERFPVPANANGGNDEDPKIDPDRVCRVFEHFASGAAAGRLVFDPRRLPAEVLVHVVDLDLSDEELAWLSSRRADPAALYRGMKYFDSFDYDRARKIGTDPRVYVLPSILKHGGSYGDIAYAASESARAAGVPAVVCRAQGLSDGVAPAWVAYAANVNGKPAWDFSSARYPQDAGWPGEITDPQTGEVLGEVDVALLAIWASTAPRDRLASVALTKSVDLVPADVRVGLLRRAIDLAPGNRRAWIAIADLAAKEKFDDAAIKPVEETIGKYLRRSPEFATIVRLRTLKGRGSIEFEHFAKRAADAVPERPDLVRAVQLAVVDRLRDDKRFDDALTILTEALRKGGARSPAAACAIMSRADVILRQRDDVVRLASMYHDVFESLPRPEPTRHGRSSGYYRIGSKYADLLDELHKPQDAQAVRVKIQNVVAE